MGYGGKPKDVLSSGIPRWRYRWSYRRNTGLSKITFRPDDTVKEPSRPAIQEFVGAVHAEGNRVFSSPRALSPPMLEFRQKLSGSTSVVLVDGDHWPRHGEVWYRRAGGTNHTIGGVDEDFFAKPKRYAGGGGGDPASFRPTFCLPAGILRPSAAAYLRAPQRSEVWWVRLRKPGRISPENQQIRGKPAHRHGV